MRCDWLYSLGVTILMLAPPSASATLVIDNFLNSSSDTAVIGGTDPATSNTTLTGLSFTTRVNTVGTTFGTPPSTANLLTTGCTGIADTCMAAGFDPGVIGFFEVDYSGGGAHDFTESGANDVIRIVTAFSDASAAFPVVVDITVTDNVGGSFTVFNVVTPPAIFFPATGVGLTEVAFTQFGTVDFSQVTGATFRFDTGFPATDYEFLFLGATESIPEPGSLSLLGLGLLCLAASAYRRKRRLNQG